MNEGYFKQKGKYDVLNVHDKDIINEKKYHKKNDEASGYAIKWEEFKSDYDAADDYRRF